MAVARNDPCPCGSGKKYKKCCLLATIPGDPSKHPSPRFRFEHGSYGGPGRQYMPSAICHEQIAPGQWRDHFCLVNPTQLFENEDDASARAEADLNEAAGRGEDAAFAASLKSKGYVSLDGFRRAQD